MRNRTGRGASETVTIAFEGALEREGEREREREGGRAAASDAEEGSQWHFVN